MMTMRSNNCDTRIVGGPKMAAEDKDNKDNVRSGEKQEDLIPDDST